MTVKRSPFYSKELSKNILNLKGMMEYFLTQMICTVRLITFWKLLVTMQKLLLQINRYYFLESKTNNIQEDKEVIELRKYQKELLEQAIERNSIVVIPTGTGKTAIAIEVYRKLSYRKKNFKGSKLMNI